MQEPDDISDKKAKILEKEAWKRIVTSDDWKYFLSLLSEHKAFLNKSALNAIDSREHELAFGYRIRANECRAILQLVEGRLAELKKGNKENDNE